mmetsp:Transcript_16324/g.49031  ORF Transcript_16324/g.49031 Transcript_16324/m.49031 type:complete len:459 (-) Transcript_16324:135-1511(-)
MSSAHRYEPTNTSSEPASLSSSAPFASRYSIHSLMRSRRSRVACVALLCATLVVCFVGAITVGALSSASTPTVQPCECPCPCDISPLDNSTTSTPYKPTGNFVLFVLGSLGGYDQSATSGYMFAMYDDLNPSVSSELGGDAALNYVVLDAGTVAYGLRSVILNGSFYFDDAYTNNGAQYIDEPWNDPLLSALENYTRSGYLFSKLIHGYLISHAHYDHNIGLILDSVSDVPGAGKYILGNHQTVAYLNEFVYNSKIWSNVGPQGTDTYTYELREFRRREPVPNTRLTVELFPLTHGTELSTAFLIEGGGRYVLYFGDTGADSDPLHPSQNMSNVWEAVAPLVANQLLDAILLECSWTDSQSPDRLFGHLTPELFMEEMNTLNQYTLKLTSNPTPLRGLPTLVTHIKPESDIRVNPSAPHTTRETIQRQLASLNSLQLDLIYPLQGERHELGSRKKVSV